MHARREDKPHPRHNSVVTHRTHPFAGGGGGSLFEYEVATLLAVEMLLGRFTRHEGVASAISLQTGPHGFDDQTVLVELLDMSPRQVHIQCRVTQPFIRSNVKFASLLEEADAALLADPAAFAAGERRLAIYVRAQSPAHASMSDLCDLARRIPSTSDFLQSVEASAGGILSRWKHCLDASQHRDPRRLHQILACIEVCALDLRRPSGRDYVELVNRLAEAWAPRDYVAATSLLDRIHTHLLGLGPIAGTADSESLRRYLEPMLPPLQGVNTGRNMLNRRRDASILRVTSSLRQLGVQEPTATELAKKALLGPPRVEVRQGINILTGDFGAGKTTELERLHIAAIDRALQQPRSAIPVLMQAGDLAAVSMLPALRTEIRGLGDPFRTGVFLTVDGVDELGADAATFADRFASVLAEWPASTIVLATRPQAPVQGYREVAVPLLDDSEVEALLATVCGEPLEYHLRPELEEALKRPLFAIHYAVSRRERDWAALHEAELVDSLGRQALTRTADTSRAFDLLVSLGARLMDSGGKPVPVRSVDFSPIETALLVRSGVVRVKQSQVTFGLDVLAEWFAGFALRDANVVARTLATPRMAHRWRYAFVHALRRAASVQADDLMRALLANAPGVAAWAFERARSGQHRVDDAADSVLAESPLEAGGRVRTAMQSWISPWPALIRDWTSSGSMPTLGVAIDGANLTTVWARRLLNVGEPIMQLPARIDIHDPATEWSWEKSGRSIVGEMWPWDWTFAHIRQQVRSVVSSLRIVEDFECCRAELAWAFAQHVLRGDPRLGATPVLRSSLEEVVSEARSRHPYSEVILGSSRSGPTLSEAEKFIADLRRFDIEQVECPWPTANRSATRISASWTLDRLVRRLDAVTRSALDVYKLIAETHCPQIAQSITTYQLLPARVVGSVCESPVDDPYGEPAFFWYLEPLPMGSFNEARWSVVSPDRLYWEGGEYQEHFARRRAQVRKLRPEAPQNISLVAHMGLSQIGSATPGTDLALSLLQDDLMELSWLRGPGRTEDTEAVRPRFPQGPQFP